MPANERSRVDQPALYVRPQRRRLLAHLTVFAIAGLLCTVVGSSPTSAAPSVQDNRYLEGGSLEVTYTCGGADQATQQLLAAIGLASFPQNATILSAAVEPSPSPGEDFDMEFTWVFVLDPGLVQTAVDLGQTTLEIKSADEPMSAVSGATGPDVSGDPASQTLNLGDGTQAVGYTHGPFTGTLNRTAAVDEPIVFAPGVVDTTVISSTGIQLLITCSPEEGAEMSLLDQDGVAPSTTTTTLPEVTTTVAPTTTVAVGGTGELPRTGTSSTLLLVVVALGLIDLGYLALTAAKPPRRRRASSVH